MTFNLETSLSKNWIINLNISMATSSLKIIDTFWWCAT